MSVAHLCIYVMLCYVCVMLCYVVHMYDMWAYVYVNCVRMCVWYAFALWCWCLFYVCMYVMYYSLLRYDMYARYARMYAMRVCYVCALYIYVMYV